MKDNLPWFTHDNDAASHPKHKALRARYGWEGYGRFWALNEMVARAEDCRLDLSRPVLRASFAADLGLSDQEMAEFLAFLADPGQCGLIHYEDGIVTTDRTQEDYERAAVRRQQDRARKRPRDPRGRFRPENGTFHAENADFRAESTIQHSTAQHSTRHIDDDGDPQKVLRPETDDFRTENPDFHAESLRAVLSRSAPHSLTVSDALLAELQARLKEEALDVGYVTWWGEYVRRQPNLANPGGYYRAHFGERAEEYRAALLREERRRATPDPGERATLQDIEAANERLPPEVRKHVAAACKAGAKTDRPRDGPLPAF